MKKKNIFDKVFYTIMIITIIIALTEVALRAHNTLEIYSIEEEAERIEISNVKDSFEYTLKEEEKEQLFNIIQDSEWYYDLTIHKLDKDKTKYEIKVYDKNSVHELILFIENKRVIMYNYDLQNTQNNKYYISYNNNLLKYVKHLQENYT